MIVPLKYFLELVPSFREYLPDDFDEDECIVKIKSDLSVIEIWQCSE